MIKAREVKRAVELTRITARCQACGGRMIMTTKGIVHEKNEKGHC